MSKEFSWDVPVLEGVFAQVRDILDPKPGRTGVEETPLRVAKAWKEWTSGYNADIKTILKTFDDGAQDIDGMVIVKDIPFYSHCEHHYAPFFGTVSIGYIPNAQSPRIVGLSKLARVTDAFSKRFQVQERMTVQIARAINEHLQPAGVGVISRARHMCMESRGVCKQGSETVFSKLIGVIKDEPQTRAEFMLLSK